MRNDKRWPIERLTVLALGVYLFATAVVHAAQGRWLYVDYLRLQVPVPIAAALGAILLVLALFRWRR